MKLIVDNDKQAGGPGEPSRFMSVKEVSEYLHLNEKKVYALVREGKIPATKVTGKWVFPRELVDRWILESSHGGLLTDRLIVAGSDDPLLRRVVMYRVAEAGARALVSYSPTGTRLGLELLAASRADVCGLHWGPAEESAMRHPALLERHRAYRDWVLVRAFEREQGLLVRTGLLEEAGDLGALLAGPRRWAVRQEGSGSQRFLVETLARHGLNVEGLRKVATALSEHEAAALVAMGEADLAPGVRPVATEFDLEFVATGWEAFDLATHRGVYFRKLFQGFLQALQSDEVQGLARRLGGYRLAGSGELVWGAD
ncbi:MAG: helix-turn-helix transcriptional regulator [Gammaproteobacteria bacterium]|nr:helix-turn-helix transcriptional regulator [Gammaproteobacteria bacterium]